MKKKIEITFNEWEHTCGDGCCFTYGVNTIVDGVELPLQNDDTDTIVQQILEHLGYEVQINRTYERD